MNTWLLTAVLTIGSAAMKAVGPLVAGGRQPPAPLTRVIALLTPALITALIVEQTFTTDQHLVIDARAAGLLVGAVTLWLRAPAAVALLLTAGTVALLRLLL